MPSVSALLAADQARRTTSKSSSRMGAFSLRRLRSAPCHNISVIVPAIVRAQSGRPRDPQIDAAVLDATIAALGRSGYGGLTFEEVAREAGTTKPAIYRRWPSRQRLVLAALGRRISAARAPDTGCTLCDLDESLKLFVAAFRRMPPGVIGPLFADCAGDPELRAEFMTALFDPPRAAAREALERARTRGDLRDEVDVELILDLIGSFVHYRALFGHAPTSDTEIERTVEALLQGIATDYPRRSSTAADGRRTGGSPPPRLALLRTEGRRGIWGTGPGRGSRAGTEFRATSAIAAMPPATTSTRAQAVRGRDPQRLALEPVGAGVATRTSSARPTAAPIEVLVEATPEATPCSLSPTPVPAAMNIAVKTTPSPTLSSTSPGISARRSRRGHRQAEHQRAERADGSAATSVGLSPQRVTN